MPSICQMVINLINAMDDANIGATQAAPGGKTFAPAEPVDDLSVHIDEVSMSPLYCNRPPCTGWLLSARLLARCTLLCLAQIERRMHNLCHFARSSVHSVVLVPSGSDQQLLRA